MNSKTDVLIIGAGISGISCALSLVKANYKGKITIIDSGNKYDQRYCYVDKNQVCQNCDPCNTFNGFGGSVHIGNSAKLSSFPSGRRLFNLIGETNAFLFQERALLLFEKKIEDFKTPKSNSFAINYKTYPISIIPELEIEKILNKWFAILNEAKNTEILFNTNVLEINPNYNGFDVIVDNVYKKIKSEKVIVSVGRQGIYWWRKEIRKLKLRFSEPTISKGLRFVIPNEFLNKVSNLHPDFKTSIVYKNKKFKTFCFSAGEFGGRIKHANYGEFMLIDGHGIYDKELLSKHSNFAILTQITENNKPRSFNWIQKNLIIPFVNANKDFPGKPLIQKYIDFKEKRSSNIDLNLVTGFNSKNYYCADLSKLFTNTEHEGLCFVFEQLIKEFISGTKLETSIHEALSNTYVIGIEIEGFWDVLEIDSKMQSSYENLFVIGDCAGVAHGVLQASISGCIAANAIYKSNF